MNRIPCTASRSQRGFTLIELLVVIAIIAILAAILFPVFAQAREKARQTSCLSNTKQTSLAMIQYNQDYDERMPNAYAGGDGVGSAGKAWSGTGCPLTGSATTSTVGNLGGWMYYCTYTTGAGGTTNYDPNQGSINPYMKSAQVYTCPSDATGQKNSYAYNRFIVPTAIKDSNGVTITVGIALATFRAPANTILFAEEADGVNNKGTNDGWFAPDMTTDPNVPPAAGKVTKGDGLVDRHSGGSCVALADGHSKWYKPTQLTPALVNSDGTANTSASSHDNLTPRWEP